MEDHRYSTFALDLYWAAPTDRDAELEQHVATCDRCRAYVAQLGELDRPIAVRQPTRRRWLFGAAFVAIAIAIVVFAWPRHAAAPTVAAKGEPGIQILVHRGSDTTVWNAAPVHAGDALAVRLACDEMKSVTVAVPEGTQWHVAYEGACVDGVLPFTLVVDDQPGTEQVVVVLGQTPLDGHAVQRAVEQQTRGASIWTTRFTFTKEIR